MVPGADVHAFADFGIAQIGEVVGLGPFAQPGLLGFDEVADVGPFADIATRPQVRVRPKLRAVAHDGIFQDAAGTDQNSVANLRNW